MIKIIKEDTINIDESKFNKQNLYYHGIKRRHLYEYSHDPRFTDFNKTGMSALLKLYNDIGDQLSNSKAGPALSNERIVGFVDKSGRNVKYDNMYGDYIVFTDDATITMFKKTRKQYLSTVQRDFLKELPENENTEEENI